MNFEDIFTPAVAPIVGACISAVVGINAYFIRWLVKSFDGLRDDIKENTIVLTKWMNDHEDLDQSRHEQNLNRFEKISVSLARLGSPNGTYDYKENK